MDTAKDLLNYFESNIKYINNEKYINYNILTTILLDVKDNKDKYIKESFNDYKLFSDSIKKYFSELIFDNKPAKLSDAQQTYNGISIIENSLKDIYSNYLNWGPGGEIDHTDMHTGYGNPGTDFIVSNNFTFNYFNNGFKTITLSHGTKLDAKSFLERKSMDRTLTGKDLKKYSHFGDYIIVYLLIERCWYIVNTDTAEVMPLLEFNCPFSKKLLKFYEDENMLFSVKYFF